jgi:hypothetical protein
MAELENVINTQSAQAKSFQRDLFAEACFLRLIVLWENFIEEYFLSCMCSAKTLSNKTIQSKDRVYPSKNEAFKKLNIQRRDRDKDYIDWQDADKIQQRVSDFFHAKSRLHKIYQDRTQLYISRVVRNLIAHNSHKSLREFKTFIINQLRYLPFTNPNAADLLLANERHSNRQFIYIYLDYYKHLEIELCK